MLDLAAEQLQNPLIPNLTELIVGLVTFGIIFFALWKVLLPRLNQTLTERTDKIEGGLQRAEEAQAEANATLAKYREQLAEARHEAARLREEAREQGAQIIAEMRDQAYDRLGQVRDQGVLICQMLHGGYLSSLGLT